LQPFPIPKDAFRPEEWSINISKSYAGDTSPSWIFCLVYIDDIMIYLKSYEEHIEHLDKVLAAIEKSGITLSPTKCHLFYGSILLLGHKVSHLRLSTHEEKVKAIIELERLKKLSQLQTFLGMVVVYFSVFIPYYASICTPLFHLLRKGCKWKWGAEEEHTFQAVKDNSRCHLHHVFLTVAVGHLDQLP